MIRDALGDRMKTYYEEVTKTKLTRRTPVIIRLDGKAFHTFTKGFRKPFDNLLVKTMQATMKYLCENIQGCVLGYTQSDEITLVLVDYAKFETSAWYDYEIQKMVSISAAMATFAFNKYFNDFYLEQLAEKGEPDEYDLIYDRARRKGALFDSRVFNIPKEEVTNCILWRQLDAERNSINSLAQSLFSHKELQGLNLAATKSKIETQKGIIWGNLPTTQKRGSCCVKNIEYILDDDFDNLHLNKKYFEKVEHKNYYLYEKEKFTISSLVTKEMQTGSECQKGTFFLELADNGTERLVFFFWNKKAEPKALHMMPGEYDELYPKFKVKSEWVIDNDIPRFIDKGRDYIEKLVFVGE